MTLSLEYTRARCVINQYVVYPLPFDMVVLWCVFGMIQFVIYGILTALIYKPVEG